VTSSQIHAIGHLYNTLVIQFNDSNGNAGSIYHYDNFTKEDFVEMKSSESVGSYFYRSIKNEPKKYPYRRIS